MRLFLSLAVALAGFAVSQDGIAFEAGDVIEPSKSSTTEHRLPVVDDVARKWTLSAHDPVQSCEVDLIGNWTFPTGSVVSGFDCPDGVFNVVSWQLEGMELRFLSPTGRVMARFYRTGWGWQGERENDGAILILVPPASSDNHGRRVQQQFLR
jgi:hypothetical protein